MRVINNQDGYSYILALTIIMIMGIMFGMIGQSWRTVKQRELEEEMIFRGDQVAELIYQGLLCKSANPPQTSVNQFLWTVNSPKGTVLDDLVIGKEETCVNSQKKKFRLRLSASLDPFTNSKWRIAKPVGDDTRFAGVSGSSIEEPFRKSFKDIYDTKLLDDKKQYSDWSFTWELKSALPQTQGVQK